MTIKEQHELGKTLWRIADDLRGSMMADDFLRLYAVFPILTLSFR